MTTLAISGLSEQRRTVIMRAGVTFAALVLLCLSAERADAQQPSPKSDDLDVTMQIIVDPDAKLPDEVVRRIPLPARKPAETPPANARDPSANPDTARNERSSEASEHGREAAEAAQERAREAAEQREAARRAAAEERRRDRGPPDDRPNPPNRPPRN